MGILKVIQKAVERVSHRELIKEISRPKRKSQTAFMAFGIAFATEKRPYFTSFAE